MFSQFTENKYNALGEPGCSFVACLLLVIEHWKESSHFSKDTHNTDIAKPGSFLYTGEGNVCHT